MVSPAAFAQDVDADPLGYCQGAGGPLGMATDSEHRVLAGDPPLPPGLRASRVTVEGVSTRVVQGGPANSRHAVVFVHGSPDSARDWDDLSAAVGGFARTVAFDVPGYGQSDKTTRGLRSTKEVGRYLEGLLDQIGVSHAVLVAHDFGGPWGLGWAVSNPDALSGVVLLNTGALIDYFPHPRALQWATPGVGETEVATTTRERFRSGVQEGGPLPDAFVNRLYDDYDRATRCSLLRYYRASIPADANLGREYAEALRPLNRPALVIWGRNDPFIPVEQAERQRQAFPSARVEIFDESGHWPFVDNPSRTRSLVVPFLRPRLIVGLPQVGARRRGVRTPVRVQGVLPAHAVRASLRSRGAPKRVGRASREFNVLTRRRLPAVRSRRALPPGRYTVTVTARGLPTERRSLRVTRTRRPAWGR
jgi:pimeloyl-ACP methyl ester carboxylesterase